MPNPSYCTNCQTTRTFLTSTQCTLPSPSGSYNPCRLGPSTRPSFSISRVHPLVVFRTFWRVRTSCLFGLSTTQCGQDEISQQAPFVGPPRTVVSSDWSSCYLYTYVQSCRRFLIQKLISQRRTMPCHRNYYGLSFRVHHELCGQCHIHWPNDHNHVDLEFDLLIL